jgi:putative inorganic carbon (HCO3(-)) transporter
LHTGIGHYVPLAAYLGFWLMIIVSLVKRPLYGFYYMIPFVPYRTMRDHFLVYPLGANMLTILVLAVIVGALIQGKRLPKSNLYIIWLVIAAYLYLSLWVGVALSNAPLPLWLNDLNFVTWKDYIVIPLIFVAAGLVIEDRKAIKTTILIVAVALALIDRACILESMSRSWGAFDENKRDPGPLSYGPNQTSAFLVQFAMFFWGITRIVRRVKFKVLGYGLVAVSLFASLYTFSRAGYIATLLGVLVLGLVKDRKLLIVLGVFLVTWQAVVPTAVRERVTMTKSQDGQLDASAEERIALWQNAENAFFRSPIVGQGYGTFQLGSHVDNLKDTHNWYVKVLVETGLIGMAIVLVLLEQMLATSFRLYRSATDPLYRGLGLGLLLATCCCIVTNCFGDRWTYLEISGLLWVLLAAAARALELPAEQASASVAKRPAHRNPYLAAQLSTVKTGPNINTRISGMSRKL